MVELGVSALTLPPCALQAWLTHSCLCTSVSPFEKWDSLTPLITPMETWSTCDYLYVQRKWTSVVFILLFWQVFDNCRGPGSLLGAGFAQKNRREGHMGREKSKVQPRTGTVVRS